MVFTINTITVIGSYGIGEDFSGGQAVKTLNIIEVLSELLYSSKVSTLNTHSWKKSPFTMLFNSVKSAKNSKDIILVTAKNGTTIFIPLFLFLKVIFNIKIHYVVVGGWLPNLLEKNKILCYFLKKIDYIYVETETLKIDLEKKKINNIFIMRNFKKLSNFEPETYVKTDKSIRLCYFSRIVEQKGIKDIIDSVMSINSKYENQEFILDIYGYIDPAYKVDFNAIQMTFPDYIKYFGIAEPKDASRILSQYDLQVFPTRYKTEGIPGSIIDSLYAGTPVLCSRWNSYQDILSDYYTAISYSIGDTAELEERLEEIRLTPSNLKKMRENCLLESLKFDPLNAIQPLLENLNA